MTQKVNDILEFFYPLFKPFLPFMVYAYLIVGALNTLLNILLYALLYEVMLTQSHYLFYGHVIASYNIALLVAFVLTVPTGFWLSKQFAFTNSGNGIMLNLSQFFKYFLVVAQGLICDYLFLWLLIEVMNVQATVAKIFSTIIIVSANFVFQKFFTFKT